ncbi:amidase domain-containing protein [Amnibacterium sp.]|uniref:amidase domain-containing protein n=1 Tax=Amnibacterium sp. TaxID=1872496 RepID=UPI002626D197|nr:amidase domain-containing protein [Amnibacterium sp.]MCU1472949.1 hypothetical protein [Amnibacterium sp.]
MHSFRIVSIAAALTAGACALVAVPATAATAAVGPTPAPTSTPAPTPAPVPTPIPGEPWATGLGHAIGHTATSRIIHLLGSDFTHLVEVDVNGAPATQLTVLDDSSATFFLDVAPGYQPGAVSISLVSDDGTVVPTLVKFTYKVTNGLDKQMAYAFSHWNLNSSARFGYITDNDCANFTSQTLLARGWKQSSQWFDSGAARSTKLPIASATWVSSTAMSNWLHKRTDLAVHLGYNQAERDQVVVGDIVQFNWDSKKYPGAWLHTAVVSKVVTMPNGHHDIYYVAHTNNAQYGGSTQYFATHMTKNLRIQFWHLKK